MKHEKTSKKFFVSQKSQSDFLGSKTLTTIVASVIVAVAPLLNGCQSEKIPVYGPADPNGSKQLIGYYQSTGFSTGLNIETYKKQEEKKVYDVNSP